MKKHVLKITLAIVVIPFVLSSCLDSNYTPPDYEAILRQNLAAVDQTQLAKDKQAIDDSLSNWGVNGVQIEPRAGVRYVIGNLGTGPKPTLESIIVVGYKAKRLTDGPDGEPFDSNSQMQTYLNSLILGWQTTMPLLPEGSIITMYIPSGLAYGPREIKGANGDPVLESNSNLIFEVELKAVYN